MFARRMAQSLFTKHTNASSIVLYVGGGGISMNGSIYRRFSMLLDANCGYDDMRVMRWLIDASISYTTRAASRSLLQTCGERSISSIRGK